MALSYDLILTGGEIVDPSQNLRGKRDIGFKGGKVSAVSEQLPLLISTRLTKKNPVSKYVCEGFSP